MQIARRAAGRALAAKPAAAGSAPLLLPPLPRPPPPPSTASSMAARALSTNLPDYNTRVDVANIKLSKPRRDTSKPMESEAKAARRAAWQAKDDAQAANAEFVRLSCDHPE